MIMDSVKLPSFFHTECTKYYSTQSKVHILQSTYISDMRHSVIINDLMISETKAEMPSHLFLPALFLDKLPDNVAYHKVYKTLSTRAKIDLIFILAQSRLSQDHKSYSCDSNKGIRAL